METTDLFLNSRYNNIIIIKNNTVISIINMFSVRDEVFKKNITSITLTTTSIIPRITLMMLSEFMYFIPTDLRTF